QSGETRDRPSQNHGSPSQFGHELLTGRLDTTKAAAVGPKTTEVPRSVGLSRLGETRRDFAAKWGEEQFMLLAGDPRNSVE
ncbi:MAG: hypothetical protein KAT30_17055, partial [Candidatus Krumholzibacteria bacterium]|nr:hypothetical protein [Candidatus Krumholzibacteria bacterium]